MTALPRSMLLVLVIALSSHTKLALAYKHDVHARPASRHTPLQTQSADPWGWHAGDKLAWSFDELDTSLVRSGNQCLDKALNLLALDRDHACTLPFPASTDTSLIVGSAHALGPESAGPFWLQAVSGILLVLAVWHRRRRF